MSAGCYHCSVKPVGRSAGRSVVAAAAYRAGERLHDERQDRPHDYTRRHGVVRSEIVLPADARPDLADREQLWNAIDKAEGRANGRLATEIELALPHELNPQERYRLVRDFARDLADRHGIAVDFAIHQPGKGGDHRNHHAHVLCSHRQIDGEGVGEIAARRTVSKRVKDERKEVGIAGVFATGKDIKAIRLEWEKRVNRAYERAGLAIRVDHRSHKDRDIDREATKHLGPKQTAAERRGQPMPGGDENRAITARNEERAQLRAELAEVRGEIIDLQAERSRRGLPPARIESDEIDPAREIHHGREDEDEREAEPPPPRRHLSPGLARDEGGVIRVAMEMQETPRPPADDLEQKPDAFTREQRIEMLRRYKTARVEAGRLWNEIAADVGLAAAKTDQERKDAYRRAAKHDSYDQYTTHKAERDTLALTIHGHAKEFAGHFERFGIRYPDVVADALVARKVGRAAALEKAKHARLELDEPRARGGDDEAEEPAAPAVSKPERPGLLTLAYSWLHRPRPPAGNALSNVSAGVGQAANSLADFLGGLVSHFFGGDGRDKAREPPPSREEQAEAMREDARQRFLDQIHAQQERDRQEAEREQGLRRERSRQRSRYEP